MAKLIYSALTLFDGYVSDEDGNVDWTPRRSLRQHVVDGPRYNVPKTAG